MNKLIFRLTALFTGFLFGLGMIISGMADPNKVLAFLDVTGAWDPSLAFVMGGALLIYMPAYFLIIKPLQAPVVADEFCLAKKTRVDAPLISGAAIFGLGWGLAGICPGPAMSSLALGNIGVWIFFASMMVGLGVTNLLISMQDSRKSQTQTA
ncbi:YeeE/YedE family protein [Vibrio salilacus]|uniref:YeeE/YedE family protein n=1 Tax=Vibrio salilacus TaxID=1323749 RepID=UPI000C2B4B90|nr:YeeE/YedE family protein [Vibrio salilacus]